MVSSNTIDEPKPLDKLGESGDRTVEAPIQTVAAPLDMDLEASKNNVEDHEELVVDAGEDPVIY